MYYLTQVFVSLFVAWRIPWREEWAGYSPQSRTESNMTAHMHIIRIYSSQKKILPPSPPKYAFVYIPFQCEQHREGCLPPPKE